MRHEALASSPRPQNRRIFAVSSRPLSRSWSFMIGFSRYLAAGVFAAAALIATQAGADSAPTLIGSSKDWSALQSMSADGKACYAMSQPKSSEPKKAKRDPIYFLVSSWPQRHVKDEVEIVPGYEFQPDSTPA